jgi:hypothetical protein
MTQPEEKPLSHRQARKVRPDLLDRAIDAYMIEGGFLRPETEPKLHEEMRETFLGVRRHFDKIGREERLAADKARREALDRRGRDMSRFYE